MIISKIHDYKKLLFQWNKVINLISRKSVLFDEYLEDVVELSKHIPADAFVVDLGSGNGIPGLILSFLGVKHVCLVESNNTKCAFLTRVKTLSENKVDIINTFVTRAFFMECDILVARAYGTLSKVFQDTASFRVKDKYLLIKGSSIEDEIKEAQTRWYFHYTIYNIPYSTKNTSQKKSKILEICKLKCFLSDKKLLIL